jgi:hypothetical protein
MEVHVRDTGEGRDGGRVASAERACYDINDGTLIPHDPREQGKARYTVDEDERERAHRHGNATADSVPAAAHHAAPERMSWIRDLSSNGMNTADAGAIPAGCACDIANWMEK